MGEQLQNGVKAPIQHIKNPTPSDILRLAEQIGASDKKCIINFECCGGCSDSKKKSYELPGGAVAAAKLIDVCLQGGHQILFADWSVRGLWSLIELGLLRDWFKSYNPIKLCGCTVGRQTLQPYVEQMKASECGQFEMLAIMIDSHPNSQIQVDAMGNTVVFDLIQASPTDSDTYTSQILSRIKPLEQQISRFPPFSYMYDLPSTTGLPSKCLSFPNTSEPECKKPEISDDPPMTLLPEISDEPDSHPIIEVSSSEEFGGTIGHAIFRFDKGAQIILSAVHWSQLASISVSRQGILHAAQLSLGAAESAEMQQIFDSALPDELPRLLREYSGRILTATSPAPSQQ